MLKIADSDTMYKGFTIKAGYVLFIENGEIIAIADGWHR